MRRLHPRQPGEEQCAYRPDQDEVDKVFRVTDDLLEPEEEPGRFYRVRHVGEGRFFLERSRDEHRQHEKGQAHQVEAALDQAEKLRRASYVAIFQRYGSTPLFFRIR